MKVYECVDGELVVFDDNRCNYRLRPPAELMWLPRDEVNDFPGVNLVTAYTILAEYFDHICYAALWSRDFKREVLMGLVPGHWTLTDEDVRKWIAGKEAAGIMKFIEED